MTSKNKKKVESINNSNVNTKLRNPVPILPKPTVLEENLSLPSISFIDITSELASTLSTLSTSKETTIELTEVYTLLFLSSISLSNLFNTIINILFYK